MRFLKIASFCLFFGSFFSYGQYTETINSNRPGNSQGAFSVGTAVLQLETGVKFGSDKHEVLASKTKLWAVEYALRYGLFIEQLEINLHGSFLSQNTDYPFAGTMLNSNTRNFEYNTLGLKYLVYDPYKNGVGRKVNVYSWKANQRFDWSQLLPAVSLYAGMNMYLQKDNPYLNPEEERFSPKVALISQNNWTGGWVFVINVMADKIGTQYPSYSGIVTLTHSFNSKFAAFGEFQSLISDIYSDEIVRGGMAYLFHKNFQADISGLLNFKDTPSRWQVAFGISYRLDMHKQEEYLNKEPE